MEGAIFAAFVAPWVAAGTVRVPALEVGAQQGMPVPSHTGAKATSAGWSLSHAAWINWAATDPQAQKHKGLSDWT
jgi:hypothetical protein